MYMTSVSPSLKSFDIGPSTELHSETASGPSPAVTSGDTENYNIWTISNENYSRNTKRFVDVWMGCRIPTNVHQ